jgi:hypothetical protein
MSYIGNLYMYIYVYVYIYMYIYIYIYIARSRNSNDPALELMTKSKIYIHVVYITHLKKYGQSLVLGFIFYDLIGTMTVKKRVDCVHHTTTRHVCAD